MPASLLTRVASALNGVSVRRVRTLWSGEFFALLATLASAVLVARGLGAVAYGRFALLITFTGLLATFADPRASEIVTKYFGAHTARQQASQALVALRAVICLDATAVVVAFTLVMVTFPFVPRLAPGNAVEIVLAAVAATTAAPVVTSRAVLASLDRYRTISLLQTASTLLRSALMGLAVVLTGEVVFVLAALAATGVVEVTVTAGVALRAVRTRHGSAKRGGLSRALVHEALPGLQRFILYSESTTFLGAITKFGDTLALGAIAGPEQAGFYRFARSLTAPVANLTTPMQTVVYNRLVNVHVSDGEGGMVPQARRATRLAVPLALALLLAVPALPWLVVLLAGDEFRPSGLVAMILLAGAALALPAYWTRPYYLVLDRLRTWFRVSVVVAGLSAAGFVLGAAIGGATGVASARILAVSLLGNLLLALPVLRARH